MSLLSCIQVELRKIRRTKIMWILVIPVLMMWGVSVMNADINFKDYILANGISPENNFFIQSVLGFTWFMYPSSMVVITVMMTQTELKNKGILKMMALPVSPVKLCAAKFIVFLCLCVIQVVMLFAGSFPAIVLASRIHGYDFGIAPLTVCRLGVWVFLVSIPMMAVYWMISTVITNPVFSLGAGLASVVPAVLMINTKLWFAYPMCYPMMAATLEMNRMSGGTIPVIPAAEWIAVSVVVTAAALGISLVSFGRGGQS